MYKPARLHDASSHTAAMSRALMTQCSSGVGSFPHGVLLDVWLQDGHGVMLVKTVRDVPCPPRGLLTSSDSASVSPEHVRLSGASDFSRDRSSPAAIWPGCSTSSPPAAGLRPATQSRPGRALGNRDPRTAKYRLPHVQPQPGVEGSDTPELSVVPSLLADRRDQICGLARRRQDPIGFRSPTHA
jgi:hypothetical protein